VRHDLASGVDDDLDALRRTYLRRVKTDLPAAAEASAEPWPVTLDHCFMRIVLDNLLGRCWYDVLDRRKPAYMQLSAVQLHDAIRLADAMLTGGVGRVRALNDASLRLRGKRVLPRRERGHNKD
jgi:hypothetical protein